MNKTARARTCAALLLILTACTKGDAPRADSAGTAAGAGQTGAGSPAALRASASTLPGQLTKPLDSYTGDELYAFVQNLSFTADSVRNRNCKNNPGCGAGKPKRIKVAVSAVVGQDSLSAGTTPALGVVYVRAINQGDAEEARYGMKAGRQLQFYLVILPDPAGGMRWRLEQLDTTAGARSHLAIGTGVFQPCGHAWKKGAGASFATCQKSAAAHDSVLKLGLLKQTADSDSDPIWSTCAMGCCVGTT